MPEYKHLLVESEKGRATITLNRPPVNVLNIEMMRELCDVFDSMALDNNLRVLVINAEGKAFSAGVDVSEHTEDKVYEMIEVFGNVFKKLYLIRALTIAAVKGAALGGGCELALGCDLVVASEKAKFGQPEIKVGVFPPMAAVLFPRLIGRNRALEWLMSGEIYSAAESERIGLINQVYPVDDFDDMLEEYIGKFTANSAAILALTKETVDRTNHLVIEEEADLADKIYLEKLMKTRDAHEGLTAFLEKRPPVWSDE